MGSTITTDATGKKVRLFDSIIADLDGTKTALNSKLTENSTKRKFQAAFDDCERIKDESTLRYNNVLTNIAGININALVDAKNDIIAANNTQDLIKQIYTDLFDEDLNS